MLGRATHPKPDQGVGGKRCDDRFHQHLRFLRTHNQMIRTIAPTMPQAIHVCTGSACLQYQSQALRKAGV